MERQSNKISSPREAARLASAYFEGETSLQDERALREYLESPSFAEELSVGLPDDIAGHLLALRALMGSFAIQRELNMPLCAGDVSRSEELHEADCSEEVPAVDGITVPKKRSMHNGLRRVLIFTVSAAAIIALAVISRVHNDGGNFGRQDPVILGYVNGIPITDFEMASAVFLPLVEMVSENVAMPMAYLEPLEGVERAVEILRQTPDAKF